MTETLQTPVRELTTGSTFAGRYQVIEELGHGGMGKVYRAMDKKLNEEVAIKLIRPEIARDKGTLERFQNELKVARKISHRNIGRMYELMEDQGLHFITMEYVPGEDLRSFLHRSKRLTIGTAVDIAKDVCEGLAEAHRLGVIHRDLKPSNIMIDKDGNARIMDFGIARSTREKGVTGSGVMIGTPEYMSPEQAEAKEVDARADIYSLGIILYEMATGRVPFTGETALSVVMKQKSETAKSPKSINPNIPGDLSALILTCLEKEKAKRYPSAGDLRADLERIEQGLPTTERVAPVRKPSTSKAITVTVTLRRKLIPVLACLGIAVAAFFLWRTFLHKTPNNLSIAVLPFTDELSPDGRLELGESMAEEITGRLRSLKKFPVKSNFAVTRFKGTNKNLKSIGEELRVDYLITGRIRTTKGEIEVYVELTEATSENQVWDEHYPDQLSNIMGIQGRIAERIGSSILKALTPEDQEILHRQPTGNPEAYRLYVQGRQSWNRRNEAGYRRAEECFKQAVALDPKYAKAYAGLADVYSLLRKNKEARDAVQVALRLDPQLAEAHASLGNINLSLDFNINSAEGEFKRSLELDPEYSVAHFWYGRLMNMRGRFAEAIIQLNQAIELDPTAPVTYENLGVSYMFSGRYNEAIIELKKSIEMDPTSRGHKIQLYWTYIFASRYQDLFDALKVDGESESIIGRFMTHFAYLLKGEKESAREFIIRNETALGAVSPSLVSMFYFHLGDADKAMGWAEKAIEVRDYVILYSYVNPLGKPFHSNPRYKALLKRLGLVD